MIIDIKENILDFYAKVKNDSHHRYRSWEHCYSYFQTHQDRMNESEKDKAILHLAFYLASWGMYRGSTGLLQKDYLVHSGIVDEILSDRYSSLWDLDFDSLENTDQESDLIFLLVKELRIKYFEVGISPTNTLISKVLLGTLCCIPAYDTLFVDGVSFWRDLPESYIPKFPAYFGRNSYSGLVMFYHYNKEEILAAQDEIAKNGIRYPVMKLIDMYFWNLGNQLT